MSANNQTDNQGGAGRREVAYRLFATEFDDSTVSHSDSDEERAPNYVITPTGARVNRLFVVGVLTEVESVSEDVLRARVVDPTGAFVIYAGQYQPDPLTFLERAEPPAFVAVTGKARTYQPEDSDRIFTSIRPESINDVDSETRDRWTIQTAEQTIERIETFLSARDRPESGSDLESALRADGVDVGLAAGIPLAIAHYNTTDAYLVALHRVAVDAVRVVANDREEVPPLELAPDEGDSESVDIETDAIESPSVQTEPTPETTSTETDTSPTTTTTADQPDSATQAAAADESESTSSPAEANQSTETVVESSEGSATTAETTADTGDTDTEELGDFDDFGETDAGGDREPESEPEPQPEPEPGADLDVASDEMYEFDEEEREEIEEEYGTEFSTGTEVDEPGAADIETPAPEHTETDDGIDETAGADSTETDADPAQDSAADEASVTEERTTEATSSEAATEPEPEPASASTEDEDDPRETETETATAATAENEDTDEEHPPEDDDPVDLDEAVIDVMAELDDGDGADRESLIETITDRHGVDAGAVEDAIQDALMSGQCYEPDEGRLKAI